jgi:hypothetical protein
VVRFGHDDGADESELLDEADESELLHPSSTRGGAAPAKTTRRARANGIERSEMRFLGALLVAGAVACGGSTETQRVTEVDPNLPGAGVDNTSFCPDGGGNDDAWADADLDATGCTPIVTSVVTPPPAMDATR